MDPEELAGYVEGWPERFVPELMAGQIVEAHHVARYLWAAAAVRGRSVLDAGCGVGYGSAILAAAGARAVTGVDLSESALAAARPAAPEVQFERADLRALPFEAETFDAVVCFEVIEHVEHPEGVIAELARVLAPDGVALVSSPNPDVYAEGNPHHLRELRPSELEDVLRRHFSEVALQRQAEWSGSAILDDAAFAGRGELPSRNATMHKLVSEEPGRERFTVAVASNGPLPELAPSLVLTQPPPRADPARLDQLREEIRRLRRSERRASAERDRAEAALRELRASQRRPSRSALGRRLRRLRRDR